MNLFINYCLTNKNNKDEKSIINSPMLAKHVKCL